MRIPSPDDVMDIIEAAYNPPEKRDTEGPEPLDCVREEGFRLGAVEGREDFNTRTLGTPDPGEAMRTDTNWANCLPQEQVDPFPEVDLPSFSNPFLAGLEVAFTPSVANAPEVEWQREQQFQRESQGAFHDGYYDGYAQEASSLFDRVLDDYLQPPPFNPDPAPLTDPDSIDARIPPLTADVSTYNSSFGGADSGFSGSSDSWSSPSGGSSDSGSGSSSD